MGSGMRFESHKGYLSFGEWRLRGAIDELELGVPELPSAVWLWFLELTICRARLP